MQRSTARPIPAPPVSHRSNLFSRSVEETRDRKYNTNVKAIFLCPQREAPSINVNAVGPCKVDRIGGLPYANNIIVSG
jgi:hypothetical protein